MKRLMAILLAGVVCLGLSGCGKEEAAPTKPVKLPESRFPRQLSSRRFCRNR